LGTLGHLHCFDASTGQILWSKGLENEFGVRMPIWGLAAAPLIESDLLILHIGGENACVVALDRKAGDRRWTALDDPASYSAPVIVDQAGKRVLVCWTGKRIVGLDPSSGALYWEQEYEQPRWVISVATPVLEGDRLFLSSFYNGSILIELASERTAASKLWHRRGPDEYQTDALHSLIVTPYLEGDYIYGVDSYGQLRCLEADTGDRVWEDRTATTQVRWGTLHMVRHAETGKIWMFNDRGELIISRLSPDGFQEISRAHLLRPTRQQLRRRNGVCWSHPAFAYRHVFNRNDEELVCASLAAEVEGKREE
jgi:outer membrane protein assembly factor BamB